MTRNHILRRIRYIFDLSDSEMIALFKSHERTVSIEQLHAWFREEDNPSYKALRDSDLSIFLNALIDERRGKKQDFKPPVEQRLSNNNILVKLKIACDLKAQDVLDILALADFSLSNHELSAFFRNPGHKHYRECKDQVMRNFLMGLQLKLRAQEKSDSGFSWNS